MLKTIPKMCGIPENADEIASLLKALGNIARLKILYYLAEGELSVSELEDLLEMRQPSLSQQLATLRILKLVKTRRVSKRIYYSLANKNTEDLIISVLEVFNQNIKRSSEQR